MAYPLSKEATALIANSGFGGAGKLEVWSAGQLAATLQVISGSVVDDETATPRRKLSCVVVGSPGLVPTQIGDLLHPLTGNELHPFAGIVIPGAVTVTETITGSVAAGDAVYDVGSYDVGVYDGAGGVSAGDGDTAGVFNEGTYGSGSYGGAGGDTGATGGVYDDDVYDTGTYDAGSGGSGETAGTGFDQGTSFDQGDTFDDDGITPTTVTVTETIVTTVTEEPSTIEWVPLGVFRMTQPASVYDGADTQITLTGDDRSTEISSRVWQGAYQAAVGLPVDQAIQQILTYVWDVTAPGLQFNLTPQTALVPSGTVFGVDFTSSGTSNAPGSQGGNDPWADCTDLADSVGCELLFDRQGVVVLRVLPVPATVPVTAQFVDGENSTLVNTLTRELDDSEFVDQVTMIGTGVVHVNSDGSTSPGAPVVATASNPVTQDGTRTMFITNAAISNAGNCLAAAQKALVLAQAVADDTSFEAVPDPSLDSGDAVLLVEPALNINATYIVSAVTHPLNPATGAMQVTNRSASVAVYS